MVPLIPNALCWQWLFARHGRIIVGIICKLILMFLLYVGEYVIWESMIPCMYLWAWKNIILVVCNLIVVFLLCLSQCGIWGLKVCQTYLRTQSAIDQIVYPSVWRINVVAIKSYNPENEKLCWIKVLIFHSWNLILPYACKGIELCSSYLKHLLTAVFTC